MGELSEPVRTCKEASLYYRIMEQKIIKIKEVLALCCISRSTVYRLIEEDKFPAPIRLSKKCRAWKISDIEKWIESRTST